MGPGSTKTPINVMLPAIQTAASADTSSARQAYIDVKVEGTSIAARVHTVEIEDNDRLIDKATIVLDDPAGDGANVFIEGQKVTVDMGWMEEYATLFEGQIKNPENQTSGGSGHQNKIVAFDLSDLLMRGQPKTRNLTGKLSAILALILGDYSAITADPANIKPDPDKEFTAPPLRQVNRLDWQFIQDQAEQFGARAFVEYNNGKSQFYWVSEKQLLSGDPMGQLHYCPGFSELIEFKYQRVASGASARQGATTVDPKTGDALIAPTPPAAPSETLTGPVTSPTSTPDDQRPVNTAVGLPSDPDPTQQARPADPTRTLGLYGQGTAVGNINIRAKGKVTIKGIADWAEGDWYVRKATHVYTRKATQNGKLDAKGQGPSTYHTKFVVTR